MAWLLDALNAGVHVRRKKIETGRRTAAGHMEYQDTPYVYMFIDAPGVYYDENGNKLSDGIASLVGFDVKRNAALKRKAEALAKLDAKLKAELEAELDMADNERVTLAQKGDWIVFGLSDGRALIEDVYGNRVMDSLPREKAMELLNAAFEDGEEGSTDGEVDVKLTLKSGPQITE